MGVDLTLSTQRTDEESAGQREAVEKFGSDANPGGRITKDLSNVRTMRQPPSALRSG